MHSQGPERHDEAFEQRLLRQLQPLLGSIQGKEPRPVHFRKLLPISRPRRPLQREMIALGRTRFTPVAFKCPSMHRFSTFLQDRAQLNERPAGSDPNLFLEFSNRRRKRLLARLDLPLGNGPHVIIPVRKPRPARVRNENLQFHPAHSVHQQTRADTGTLWTM